MPLGTMGMLVLIATESALLGSLVATYFYLALRAPHWPPPGVEQPSVTIPIVLTAVLCATTVPMWLAVRAARRRRRLLAWSLVAAATVVQGGYLAWQMVLYVDTVHSVSGSASSYGSVLLTLLAAHHGHVMIGLLLDAWLLVRLAMGITRYRLAALESAALYWLFVAVFGILVVVAEAT
jgi:heme/copper-type cytochrome/quinol oxidase subunit 3